MVVAPEYLDLLRTYYGLEFGTTWIAVSVLLVILLTYIVGYVAGRNETLRYIWRVGIPHSQKEWENLYLKFKNKIVE